MALEPAGISLQAQGFSDYVRKLDTIEKKQREVFEAKFKGTGKSFADIQKAAKDYERQLEQTRKAAKAQASTGVKELFSGDIKGISNIASGIKAIGPAATASAVAIGAVTVGATAAAAAIVGIGIASVNIASQTDRATSQIAASLGISADAAKKYRDEIEGIFVANPQAQFTEIAQAIALTERALGGLTSDELQSVANNALNVERVFGEDLQKTIGATEQLIEKFGVSSTQATDLLAFGLQNISADDLIDSVGEFSNIFADAGFDADEFFSIFQTGAAGGSLGVDKISDAVKEFQIRFLEGNKGLKDSFGVLGLNFDQFTDQVNSGQITIADVIKSTVDRIGEVDLSIAKNRAAVAGLGTQFEDLGSVIAGVDFDAIGFEDVVGASDALNNSFDNIGDALTQLQRAFLVSIAPIGRTLLDSLKPAVSAFTERVIPAFEFARESLERLLKSLGLASSSASTFETVLGATASIIEGFAGGVEILARVTETLRQVFAFARAGAAALGSIISDAFTAALKSVSALGEAFLNFINLDFAGVGQSLSKIEVFDIGASLEKAEQAAIDKFKEIAIPPVEVPVEVDQDGTAKNSVDNLSNSFENQVPAINDASQSLDAYENALSQAEDLQLSFARQAEDTARKIARANEDIARRQAKDVGKLEARQTKDRDKLLKDQQKQLDSFEGDRRKQIADAEKSVRKERQKAAEQQKRDQKKLQDELKRGQEQFNLSQLQSERRFKLQERRLIAEGDILAIQQLREDRALERKEEGENFDQSQKERVKSAAEQQREQAQDLDDRVNELKTSLEEQRAELLRSFDEQLAAQVQSQAEARAEQQRGFQEAAAERAIALAREEEDRRISQARQLEDLGRSLAEQEGVTEEGAAAIAGELEKVFGAEGVADSIFSGFKDRTESDFKDLFSNIETIVSDTDISSPSSGPELIPVPVPQRRSNSQGIPAFDGGGTVPGPIGSPQIIQAHGGETVLPTHRQAFNMQAPITSQSLNVLMSGGFDIRGGEGASQGAVDAAVRETTENLKIAIQRIARKN